MATTWERTMTKKTPNLRHRGERFYYRQRVPTDLRDRFIASELTAFVTELENPKEGEALMASKLVTRANLRIARLAAYRALRLPPNYLLRERARLRALLRARLPRRS